jgi:hypothetical protein
VPVVDRKDKRNQGSEDGVAIIVDTTHKTIVIIEMITIVIVKVTITMIPLGIYKESPGEEESFITSVHRLLQCQPLIQKVPLEQVIIQLFKRAYINPVDMVLNRVLRVG